MRTMIAIPCMSTVPTRFMTALIGMEKPEGAVVAVSESSLIHAAREGLAHAAMDGGFDRIMWLDSDMIVPADLLTRLSKDLDGGLNFVTALYFKRTRPTEPVIYKAIAYDGVSGESSVYADYPDNAIFDVAGCGFGACMMSVDALRRVYAETRYPFTPIPNLGEDLAFCLRARPIKAYCDSRIKVGHVGMYVYDEKDKEA